VALDRDRPSSRRNPRSTGESAVNGAQDVSFGPERVARSVWKEPPI